MLCSESTSKKHVDNCDDRNVPELIIYSCVKSSEQMLYLSTKPGHSDAVQHALS